MSAIDMAAKAQEGPVRYSRVQSSALAAVGFFLVLHALSMFMVLVPIVGPFFHAAMYFGSPVVGLVALLTGTKMTAGLLLWLAIVAPYPVIGLAVGYAWPLEAPVLWRAAGQIALRFGITLVLINAPGVLMH